MNHHDVKSRMCQLLRIPEARVSDDAELTQVISDSFRLVETFIELQDEFGLRLTQEDLRDVKTVGEFVQVFASHLPSAPSAPSYVQG
jgi:acyl carrier protein